MSQRRDLDHVGALAEQPVVPLLCRHRQVIALALHPPREGPREQPPRPPLQLSVPFQQGHADPAGRTAEFTCRVGLLQVAGIRVVLGMEYGHGDGGYLAAGEDYRVGGVGILLHGNGGLGGKGIWKPATTGYTPDNESDFMKAYLAGDLVKT